MRAEWVLDKAAHTTSHWLGSAGQAPPVETTDHYNCLWGNWSLDSVRPVRETESTDRLVVSLPPLQPGVQQPEQQHPQIVSSWREIMPALSSYAAAGNKELYKDDESVRTERRCCCFICGALKMPCLHFWFNCLISRITNRTNIGGWDMRVLLLWLLLFIELWQSLTYLQSTFTMVQVTEPPPPWQGWCVVPSVPVCETDQFSAKDSQPSPGQHHLTAHLLAASYTHTGITGPPVTSWHCSCHYSDVITRTWDCHYCDNMTSWQTIYNMIRWAI